MISFLKETKPERDAIVFFKVRKTAGQLQMINNDWHLTPGHQGVGEAAAN